MTMVTNTIRKPGGAPLAGATVRVQLIAGLPENEDFPGYVTDEGYAIRKEQRAVTDANGRWVLDLEPNINIDPANTAYRVIEGSGNPRPAPYYIEVPIVFFDFLTATGLQGLYLPQNIAADGAWPDSSGNGANTSGVNIVPPGGRILDGDNYADQSDGDDYLGNAFGQAVGVNMGTDWTVYAVFSVDAFNDTDELLGSGFTANRPQITETGTDAIAIGADGTFFGAKSIPAIGQKMALSVQNNSTGLGDHPNSSSLWIDHDRSGEDVEITNGWKAWFLLSGYTNFSRQTLKFAMFCEAPHDDAERIAIMDYLAELYGTP